LGTGGVGVGESGTTEVEALVAWCERLPAIRAEAAAVGAAVRLERDITRVRRGGSALVAYRKWLSTEEPGAWRTWSEPAGTAMPGLPGLSRTEPAGTGDYRCPLGRCTRRASRDESGHPPVCAAFDVPMAPGPR
jgi:hypothetical protein